MEVRHGYPDQSRGLVGGWRKTILPAGDYTVDAASDAAVLAIRALDGTASAFVVTIVDGSSRQATPELVFVHVGDTYRLESIEMGDDLVRDIPLPAEVPKAAADRVAVKLPASRIGVN